MTHIEQHLSDFSDVYDWRMEDSSDAREVYGVK